MIGHTVKHIVLKANTLFRGTHCDKAKPLEVIEQDAKELKTDGRIYRLEDGSFAIFDSKREADELIQKLGWKPEVFEADKLANAQVKR